MSDFDRRTHERQEVLFEQWIEAKEQERIAIETRRELEDRMIQLFSISLQLDGTQTLCNDGYKAKVVGRINRKIDADKLQDVAAEHGLSAHLSTLFRWKPEVNAKAWEAADPAMTDPLKAAITATPGRPSFSISKE